MVNLDTVRYRTESYLLKDSWVLVIYDRYHRTFTRYVKSYIPQQLELLL